MSKIEKINHNKKLLAMIVRGNNYEEGVLFPTPEALPLQLGLHNHKKGRIIIPHCHFPIEKLENIEFSEVFYIVKGKISLSIYNQEKEKVKEVIVNEGDIVYLIGGHGIDFLEDSLMFEIKQGPYRSRERDKEVIP